jgi:hypothetical protein
MHHETFRPPADHVPTRVRQSRLPWAVVGIAAAALLVAAARGAR